MQNAKCKMSPFRQTFGLPPSPEGDGKTDETVNDISVGTGVPDGPHYRHNLLNVNNLNNTNNINNVFYNYFHFNICKKFYFFYC